MTLEKARLQRARIGAAAGEARWRLALMNASAPAGLRGGVSEGCGWERVAEAAGAELGAPGKGRSH